MSKSLVVLPPVEFIVFGHRDVESSSSSLRPEAEHSSDQPERKRDDAPKQFYDDKAADYSEDYTEHDLTSR